MTAYAHGTHFLQVFFPSVNVGDDTRRAVMKDVSRILLCEDTPREISWKPLLCEGSLLFSTVSRYAEEYIREIVSAKLISAFRIVLGAHPEVKDRIKIRYVLLKNMEYQIDLVTGEQQFDSLIE